MFLFVYYVMNNKSAQVWKTVEKIIFCSVWYLLKFVFLHRKWPNVQKMVLAKAKKLA